MILHPIILETIGSNLVPALSRTHLLPSIQGLRLIMLLLYLALYPLLQGGASLGQTVFPTAALCCGHDTRGPMAYAAAILMLVAMLAAGTGARVPLYVQVLLTYVYLGFCGVYHGHCDSAGMHSAATFGGRYALDTMPTGLVVQSFKVSALHQDMRFTWALALDLSCSAHSIGQAEIGLGQVLHEQSAVFAAFCGTYFYASFHDFLLGKNGGDTGS
jgi:hypothetical protein